jgi:hypothetical protein
MNTGRRPSEGVFILSNYCPTIQEGKIEVFLDYLFEFRKSIFFSRSFLELETTRSEKKERVEDAKMIHLDNLLSCMLGMCNNWTPIQTIDAVEITRKPGG